MTVAMATIETVPTLVGRVSLNVFRNSLASLPGQRPFAR
jgi:hypothetical protein